MNEIKLPISGIGAKESIVQFDTDKSVNVDSDRSVDNPPADTSDTDSSGDAPTVVEIDGEDYTVDAEGNAVKDGKVFKTREELAAMTVSGEDDDSDVEDDDSGVDLNSIARELNLEFTDDNGEPVVFEPTKEGLVEFVQAVFESGASSKEVSAREQMINMYPVLEDVINYITVNGSLEGYETSSVDYNSLVLDKQNQNQLISIVRKSRDLKGDSEAEVNKFVNAIIADGSLYEIAESSLNYIKSVASSKNEDLAKQAEQIEQQRIQAHANYINTIVASVKQGTIKLGEKEVRIPVQFKVATEEGKIETRTKEQFLDYMTKEREFSLKDGKVIRATQFEVDKYLEERRLGYGKDIYDAMRLFTKGDLTSIIDKSVESRKVEDIKRKLRLQSGKSTTTKKPSGSGITFPIQQRIDKPIN